MLFEEHRGAASALLQILKEETGEVVQKAKKIMSQLELSPGTPEKENKKKNK
jgi:NTP pyrophosphatase (non-canonical NTP hydrolase)